ncbi:MAG: hypothetical protein Q8900_05445 [Bacillota bacterium]|nr:hypothetical protein [Bacillota bacterium]
METLIKTNLTSLKEIKFSIYDSKKEYYGGSQNWFPKKSNQLNGCGPVAAANITAYLSQKFSYKFSDLSDFKDISNKNYFIEHMIEIRKFVIPGLYGLTSVQQFADNTLSYANYRHTCLTPHILEDDTVSLNKAVEFLTLPLSQNLPIAILVLTHPAKELEDYVWHWMTITHLKLNPNDNNYYIVTSSYGGRHEINFNLLWNNRRAKDKIKFAYFD